MMNSLASKSLFQVKFDYNDQVHIDSSVRKFDEDEKRTLDKFDLNYWEKEEVREFPTATNVVTIIPKEEELTELLVSFFKDSSIDRGIKNWRNHVDIYV